MLHTTYLEEQRAHNEAVRKVNLILEAVGAGIAKMEAEMGADQTLRDKSIHMLHLFDSLGFKLTGPVKNKGASE